MPSNPTYPGPFGHTWDEREPRGPARTSAEYAEYDEPIELPLVRRWPAVVVASALIVALGAGLLLIHRSFSRASLGPTEELPMQPREFQSSLAVSPAWIRPLPETPAPPPEPPVSTSQPAESAPTQRPLAVPPRRGTPPPDKQPRAFAPPPVAEPEREQEPAQGFDFGSADSLRPPDDPALDPNDLAPRDEPSAARPASDDIPDADAPDADIPDGDIPDADIPDAEPPGDEGRGDPDYSPALGF